MIQKLDIHNLKAIKPLFKPWEEPLYHRIPNALQGGAAIIQPGRRPSNCPLVRSIRADVDLWRRNGYAGISATSRTLLNHWFQNDHETLDEDGNTMLFRYHWAQREAIESIIYLYELRGMRSVAELMFDFGNDALADLALGINPAEDRWMKGCCKVATGGGKTKIMSLAIVWSFFHSLYEPASELARHFVIIAPNLTVYERLKDDFENGAIFYSDPLLPEEWKNDFQVQVVLQDEPGGGGTTGAIYLTNIHRLYESRDKESGEEDQTGSIFGPSVKRAQALDTGEALRQRISSHPRLMVLNDEAHHLHDPDLAWNRAIDTLHSQSLALGHGGICLQLDFSATPRHNDGGLFNHIICDFPLGEAVDAGIVKVPVLGVSDELELCGDRNTPAHERYAMHLKLGYQRYEKTFEELNQTRKPILFVMTEDADAANEIAAHLDSDMFPLLKGRLLNIHTRLKGRIKTVKRGGRQVQEFVESETGMKPDDLRALREMSRELDAKDSKFRCVVSVMMLREGWDVRNVTTIIPLRPYNADSGILPEQTLGRGLRRMFRNTEIPEIVTVVHHPAFAKLYERELAQEGLDIASLPVREAIQQTVTIFPDYNHKPVEKLDIQLPDVSDSIEVTAELQNLTFADVQEYYRGRYKSLPIGVRYEGLVEYKERHMFTDEIVTQMQLDAGLLTNAWSAAGYYARMISRACHLLSAHRVLTPLIEEFICKLLFEHEVDLFSGEVDHRMRDVDVKEHILATFTPLVLEKTIHRKARKQHAEMKKLSEWKPYQATSTDERPAVTGQRTLFNLVPCDSEFEHAFTDFCDYASDVDAFAKNSGPQKLMIDYLRPDGHRAFYVPDFFVRLKNGDHMLVETKGKVDQLVPAKARAALEWCKTASGKKTSWQYLFVPYHLFQQNAPKTVEELARACDPALQALVEEGKSKQPELPLFEETVTRVVQDLFEATLQKAGVLQVPGDYQDVMRQAVQLLDHMVRTGMPDFSPAFQPLLRPLDDYSIRILEGKLKALIPAESRARYDYLNPYLDMLGVREKASLEKNQRYLEQNLVYGRSIQKLGTFLFCLDYAISGGWGASGIWEDVKNAFSMPEAKALYNELSKVNEFRNTRVAHVEARLEKAEEAWEAMYLWLHCIEQMAIMAA